MDQTVPTHETDVRKHTGNKYIRRVQSIEHPDEYVLADVYSVLNAFNITCPGIAHGLKKLLCAGIRKKATLVQDLKESIDAIVRSPQLAFTRTHTFPVGLGVVIYSAVDPSPTNMTLTNIENVLNAFDVKNENVRWAISLMLGNCSALYSAERYQDYIKLINDVCDHIRQAIEKIETDEKEKPCLDARCWHRDLIHMIDGFVADRMNEKGIDRESPAGQEIAEAVTLIKELDALIRKTIMESNQCNTNYTTMRTLHNNELRARTSVESKLALAMGHLEATWYTLHHYYGHFKGVCCADGSPITMHDKANKDLIEALDFINEYYGRGKYRKES